MCKTRISVHGEAFDIKHKNTDFNLESIVNVQFLWNFLRMSLKLYSDDNVNFCISLDWKDKISF